MFKNKRNLSRVLRVHSSVFVCLFLFILPVSADSFLQYVGEAFVLPPPTAPSYNAEVNSWSYSSSSKHIEVTNKGTTSPGKAVITSYFSGTEIIECFYSYTIYVNGYLHGGTGSIYHTVSCESNNISISAPRQTMQVGETMQMSYKFSKTIYDVAPEINWKSNSSAVNVGWDGTVYAAKPGEATITASSNLGGNVAEFRIKVEGIDPTSVSIPKSETVYAGESIELKATFTPSNAYSTLTWYSTDPSIATVSAGKVYGKSEGQTTIYCVTANGITSNNCKVSVNYRTPTSITCTPSELSLPIGESRQLNYSVTPSNARYTVEWLSSDKSVATVSSSGLVTAVSTGRTTIKVRTDNGKVPTCEVRVTSIDPTSVSIPKSETVYAGESIELKATFTPSNAHTTLTWHSTNPSVATVSDGTVYGKSEGQTTIYCVTANGITSNDCKVSVNYRTPTSITCTPSELSLPIGKSQQLKYTVTPSNARYTVEWLSSDKSIATVSSSGLVTAVSTGRTTIKVRTDNGKVATCEVKVISIDPTSVSITNSETVYVGESVELKAAFTPSNAHTTLTWYSTNPSVATVSDGTVYGKSEGQTTIYCVTANGITSNDCKVSVNYRTPTSITCAPSELSLPIGKSRQLNYTVTPSNARYTVEWLSSDKSVATVSSSGLVTAVSTGRTTIKVRTDNGKVATCEVNVTEQQFYDLVVWLKNGEKNMFRLSEHPVVSYADGAFILKTSRTEAEYKASSVRKFTLLDEKDDPAASVQEVKEKPNSHVYYSEDVVEMTGGKANSRVNVYRLDGKRVDTMQTDAEGNLTFSVAQYPAGTYIIESETITFKISKR